MCVCVCVCVCVFVWAHQAACACHVFMACVNTWVRAKVAPPLPPSPFPLLQQSSIDFAVYALIYRCAGIGSRQRVSAFTLSLSVLLACSTRVADVESWLLSLCAYLVGELSGHILEAPGHRRFQLAQLASSPGFEPTSGVFTGAIMERGVTSDHGYTRAKHLPENLFLSNISTSWRDDRVVDRRTLPQGEVAPPSPPASPPWEQEQAQQLAAAAAVAAAPAAPAVAWPPAN